MVPSSGQVKFSEIGNELGISISNLSLRSMSNTAGFSTPDSISEFWGYLNATYVGNFAANDPCNYEYFDIYYGNADGYYYYWTGTSYVFALNYATNWYKFLYYEPRLDANIYEKWETVFATSFTYVEDIVSLC
jgi:hypothetical protein